MEEEINQLKEDHEKSETQLTEKYNAMKNYCRKLQNRIECHNTNNT